MKTMRKVMTMILVLAMVLSLGITAFAVEPTHSITIKNNPASTNVTINGNTYTAYKLFGATYSEGENERISYTVEKNFEPFTIDAETANAMVPDFGAVDKTNVIEFVAAMKDKADALNKFAELVYVWNRDTASPKLPSSFAEANDETAVIDLSADGLQAGYYLVFGTATQSDGNNGALTSALILHTAKPTVTVDVKVDAPTVDKTVAEAKLDASAQVGTAVPFTLKSKVPNMSGYKFYEMRFNDTMSTGLTLNKEDIKLTIKGKTVTLTDVLNGSLDEQETGAYIKFDGQSFTVQLPDLKSEVPCPDGNFIPAVGDEIVLTYSATLNEKALDTNLEFNQANLQYSNNPVSDQRGEFGKTPDKKTRVFDFGLNVFKYEDGHTEIKLPGAEFKLFKDADYNGNALPAADGWYKFEGNKVTWEPDEKNGTVRTTVAESGNLDKNFFGLEEGTYFLKETKAPNGYNPIENPIRVKIAAVYDTSINNKIEKFTVTFGTYDQEKTQYVDGQPVDITITDTQSGTPGKSADLVQTVNVANSTGSVLPSTGGIGTTIFYVVGGLMMVTALVLLITKKRMAA